MRFVRVTVSHTQNKVVAVMEQDTAFLTGGFCQIDGEECETFDLGVVEDEEWRDDRGERVRLTQHLLSTLEAGGSQVARIHDCPCTLEGIKARMRTAGPAGIPIKVRAWLATVMPAEQVREMGLARGIPIAALKACEAIRNKRDPAGGSRMPYFEAIAQRQHDARRARIEGDIRRRSGRKAAAEEAWLEMRSSVEREGKGNGHDSVR